MFNPTGSCRAAKPGCRPESDAQADALKLSGSNCPATAGPVGTGDGPRPHAFRERKLPQPEISAGALTLLLRSCQVAPGPRAQMTTRERRGYTVLVWQPERRHLEGKMQALAEISAAPHSRPNGEAPAFQAGDVGSIPAGRSTLHRMTITSV